MHNSCRTEGDSMSRLLPCLMGIVWLVGSASPGMGSVGPFSDQLDIGTPSRDKPGSATFDASTQTIRVAGGGANVWTREDHMQFVWRKMSGADMTFAADVVFDKAT